MTRLHELYEKQRQSPWIDNIKRSYITGGQLAKLVEKGEFREDVFRCLTQQCRDPEYVGLDLKSQIASNNVCAKRYIELIGKFDLDFVRQAGAKMIADSERLARARLRKLPNGKWFSRVFGTASGSSRHRVVDDHGSLLRHVASRLCECNSGAVRVALQVL